MKKSSPPNELQEQNLSYGQRALWFLYHMAPDSGVYNLHYLWKINSPLNLEALQQALQQLVNRHPAMRTTFVERNGQPLQQIHPEMLVSFEVIHTDDWNEEQIHQALHEETQRPFQLDQEPPIRWRLFTQDTKPPILLLALHHIGADLWSVVTSMNELRALYASYLKGQPVELSPPGDYADFIAWQQEFLDSSKGKQLEWFWENELSGELPVLNLPTDHSRPPVSSCNGGFYPFSVEDSIAASLKEVADAVETSLFSLYLSAFHVLLHRYTGQHDILIGTPTAGRSDRFGGIYGYFVSPVVVRAYVPDDLSFLAFLMQRGPAIQSILKHQDYPFARLVEHLQQGRDTSRSPIFQVAFVWDNPNRFENRETPLVTVGKDGSQLWDLGDLTLERVPFKQQLDHFDLSLKMVTIKGKISCSLEYNSDLFEEATMARMANHFQVLLEGIARNPEQPIAQLPLLTPEEQQQMLIDWNQTQAEYSQEVFFHQFVEQFSITLPESTAVVFEGQSITYSKLNRQANQFANYLKDQGVGPEKVVGIFMERSLEIVVALLGIFKAGGVYLPLDPDYPPDRLEFMVNDAEVFLLLTQQSLMPRLPSRDVKIFCLEEDWEIVTTEKETAPEVEIRPDNLAYLIYTSGSTGMPKGVMIEHRGMCNLMKAQRVAFDFSEQDRVLQFASLNFDASIFEIVVALQHGATLYLAPKGSLLGENLTHYLKTNEITHVGLPPSVLASLPPAELPDLRILIVAGEASSASLVKQWSQGRRLINNYGPTESTVWATFAQVDGSCTPPIGRPIANTELYLLDAHLNPVPIGVPGELHIASDGLARGYLNRAEMTQERFIPHPFRDDPDARLYKTGDLCRYLPDGNVEYLGRIDHQVKIRGFRIELGEIEASLLEHPKVRDALVMARPNRAGEKRLVAYVVGHEQDGFRNRELRTFLQKKLPDYMIPSAIIILDAFPLTPNEKIDRKALPDPEEIGQRPSDLVKPRNEVEQTIADIWKDVLHIENLGVHENFFDLGGHSLLMAEVYGKLPGLLKEDLTMVDLFKYPTISTLAHYLEKDAEETQFHIEPDDHLEQLRLLKKATEGMEGQNIAIVGMSCRLPGANTIEEFWDNLTQGRDSISQFTDEELEANGVAPELLQNPDYVKCNGTLDNIEEFDAGFFGFSPREAQITDPQQRIFLECAWEALESAGYVPENFQGKIGIYGGTGMNRYLASNLYANPQIMQTVGEYPILIGNDKDFLCTRISYKLNLNGPALVVQTACSTSLVAVHLACKALMNKECDMALAGGVSLNHLHKAGYLYQEGMILSPDGKCRAFDADSKGTVLGQGAGVIVLKRLEDAVGISYKITTHSLMKLKEENLPSSILEGLERFKNQKYVTEEKFLNALSETVRGVRTPEHKDRILKHTAVANGDHIYAVIKGTAINNDGSVKAGYTAPSSDGQQQVIQSALVNAGVEADSISYVETHGTGTVLGDPIEVEGLTQAFRTHTNKKQFCAIGSVKTNIGHLDAAAGIAGLIKTALALKHGMLPPSLHFQKPNPKIDFENSPFYVNRGLKPWPEQTSPRRAGVSSFGIGGTNAHAILREMDPHQPSEPARPWQMICLSARTPSALDQISERLVAYLKTHPQFKDSVSEFHFADVAYTLHVGRKHFEYRRSLVCQNMDEAIIELEKRKSSRVLTQRYDSAERGIVFMFPGQGSQYLQMARELYQVEIDFRETVDRCREILKNKFMYVYEGLTKEDLDGKTEKLHETYITQPALFILEYSLAKLLREWDIEPDYMIGHSIGEYVAACLAGVFSLETALELVAIRGKIIQELQSGDMLSVRLSEEDTLQQMEAMKEFLAESEALSLATVNGPARCVVSGQKQAIQNFYFRLKVQDIECRRLHTSHAFHSHMMGQAVERFAETVRRRKPQPPRHPFISNITGTWITDEQATDPMYWAQHIRHTVRFSDGLKTLFEKRATADQKLIFLEVGPGKVLSTLARQHPSKRKDDTVLSTMRHPYEEKSDVFHLLDTLSHLWHEGVSINWDQFHANRQRYRVPLPNYPFERKRHWVEPQVGSMRPMLVAQTPEVEAPEVTTEPSAPSLPNTRQEHDPPRDAFEQKIAAIWKQGLGIDTLGIHDNFFELGGDSLVAVQLVGKLSKAFDAPLATHILLQQPTVANLAEFIRENARHSEESANPPESRTSPLVAIQEGKSGNQALFMVHPIGGEVYFYRDLAHALGSQQPLHTFQALSLSGIQPPYTNLRTMASHYLETLREFQPEGPYLLGGASFGGMVAYEMAHRLRQENEEVPLLVMIDTPGPGQLPDGLRDSAAILEYVLRDKIPLSLETLREMETDDQLNYIFETAKVTNRSDLIPQHLGIHLFKTWLGHQEAMFGYNPPSYDGRVLFFRHSESMPDFPPGPHLPWESLVKGELQIRQVPGTHITMNFNPHVRVLAKHLKPMLREILLAPHQIHV